MTNQIRIGHETNAKTAGARKNKNEKELFTMTNKIYKVKGSATRVLNKAYRDGVCKDGEIEIRAIGGGFQIFPCISDTGLEARWHELVCQIIPNVEDDEKLEFPWFIFQEGTTFADIYAWFDCEYSEGLDALKCKNNYWKLPGDEKAEKRNSLTAQQKSALDALGGVKALADKTDNERAGVWFPFAEIYNSTTPADLPKRSMGGIMGGLVRRGLIQFVADGKDVIGKKKVAVCLTDAGLLALTA